MDKEKALNEEPANAAGLTAMSEGRTREALINFTEAVKINPQNYVAWNNVGVLLFESGKISEAENSFKKSLGININYTDAIINIINLYIETESYSNGIAQLYQLEFADSGNPEARDLKTRLESIKALSVVQGGPLVSIIVTTYNRGPLLKMALDSIVNQTYQNYEVILVNDGGSDVQDIVNKIGDPRIRYFDLKDNFGAAHAYNYAIFESRGEFLAILNDDDLYYPNHLEVLVSASRQWPEYSIYYSDFYVTKSDITEQGYCNVRSKVIEYSKEFDQVELIGVTNYIVHMTYLFRKSILDRVDLYDQNLICLIDWDFFRRAAFYFKFKHVPILTGEWFCPVNSSTGRVSNLLDRDPKKWMAQRSRLMAKRPPKPWRNLKELNIVLHSDGWGPHLIKKLNILLQFQGYPLNIYAVMNRYSNQAREALNNLKLNYLAVIFNPEPLNLLDSIKYLQRSRLSGDWLLGIDDSFEPHDSWLQELVTNLKELSDGRYNQPDEFNPGRLYSEI